AIVTSPPTRAGATRFSQAARPGARRARPRAATTLTCKADRFRPPDDMAAPGPRAVAGLEGFVRLDDVLHQLVAHDVTVVEVHEGDALDLREILQRLDERPPPARGQA